MKRMLKVIPRFAVIGPRLPSATFSAIAFADEAKTPFVSRTVEVADVKPHSAHAQRIFPGGATRARSTSFISPPGRTPCLRSRVRRSAPRSPI